jgi:hypothetical protein
MAALLARTRFIAYIRCVMPSLNSLRSRVRSACLVSDCELTDPYSPAAIDIAPATGLRHRQSRRYSVSSSRRRHGRSLPWRCHDWDCCRLGALTYALTVIGSRLRC